MWYIYTMEYYSDIKEWHNAFCSNMGEPRNYHTKCSKTEKDTYHVISLICGIYTNELIYKTEIDSQGTSLVAQWLRVCLPVRGTRVRALVWEDPTCRGAAGPVSHNYWACASAACAPQQQRPRWWEARAPQWRVDPTCCNWRKLLHGSEDPTQP